MAVCWRAEMSASSRERAPLEIRHQQHHAQPDQAEPAHDEQGHLLRPPRGVGVAGALAGDGLFEHLDARRQRGGVAGRIGGRLLPAVLDGHLRGVELLLDLEITVHQRLRRGVRHRRRDGRQKGIGVGGENSRGQNRPGANRPKFNAQPRSHKVAKACAGGGSKSSLRRDELFPILILHVIVILIHAGR